MASATIRLTVRTRRVWALRLASRLAWLRLWPLVDWLAGLTRVECRADKLTGWQDIGVRVVRDGREIRLEQVVRP